MSEQAADPIADRVNAMMVDLFGGSVPIKRETTLAELRCDSLDRVEMAMYLEESMGMDRVSDDVVGKWKTVGDVVDFARQDRKQ